MIIDHAKSLLRGRIGQVAEERKLPCFQGEIRLQMSFDDSADGLPHRFQQRNGSQAVGAGISFSYFLNETNQAADQSSGMSAF